MRTKLLRALIAGFMVVALAFSLAGCGPKPPEPPGPVSPPDVKPQGGTLVIARDADSTGLDPHRHTPTTDLIVYAHNIIETPLNYNAATMALEPHLAEKWEVISVPDGIVRLWLREGVSFHDGTPLNAEAVVFNVERMANPESPGSMGGQFLKGAKVVDEYTVDVTLKMPAHPGAVSYLAQPHTMGLVSPAAVQKFGRDFPRNPVGTGPFKFVEWLSDNRIVLERFDGYWGDAPILDELIFKVIPEESSRMMALEAGEVDMVVFPSPSDIARLKQDENFEVHQVEGQRVVYLGLNFQRPPTNERMLRRALNWGTDRDAIALHILEGLGWGETGYVAPNIFGYKDLSEELGYNPQKAAAALDDLGWKLGTDGIREKDGQKLRLEFIYPSGRYLRDASVAEAWQGQMKEIGVDVVLKRTEWGIMQTTLNKAVLETDVFMLGWGSATGDAAHMVGPNFLSQNRAPAGSNRTHFENPDAERLIRAAESTADQMERVQYYSELMDLLAYESPFVNLYGIYWTVVTGAHVKDYVVHPIDSHLSKSFPQVWLSR